MPLHNTACRYGQNYFASTQTLTTLGVYFTGGSLNPARSIGPDVILHTFNGYHWIYWVGPALGALLAVGMYRLIKALEYETSNPGADFNRGDAEVFYADEDPHAGHRAPNSSSYDGATDIPALQPVTTSAIVPSSRPSSDHMRRSRLQSTAGQTASVYSTSPANHSNNSLEADTYHKGPSAEEGTLEPQN